TNQKRSRLLVVCESFQFLDSGRGREMAGGDAPRQTAPAAPTNSSTAAPAEMDAPVGDDDVPF
ncbi:MAG TPA: single-stranded DNA-binding protein, partial [Candidatus Paceibacterota bacterium]|nr:single-stranded DNA-binding protein [Candidatus Paceibacterota bacterium]